MSGSKGFLAGLFLGVALLVGFIGFQYFANVSCPCGFKYDPFTRACVVDIAAPPCNSGGGGGNPNPGSSGGSGESTYWVPSGQPPPRCGISTYACTPTADWKALTFQTGWGSATTSSASSPGPKVQVKASLRDSAGNSCARLAGIVVTPGTNPSTTTIPVDAGAASSHPGLRVVVNDPCRAVQFSVAAAPEANPECGCTATVMRD